MSSNKTRSRCSVPDKKEQLTDNHWKRVILPIFPVKCQTMNYDSCMIRAWVHKKNSKYKNRKTHTSCSLYAGKK